MQNIKSGKEEIVYLLNKAVEKYKSETGEQIVLNTNRKNYESLAIFLSEISNKLPFSYQQLGADYYSEDVNRNAPEYPHRKYDITGGQIKDALSGIVSNPRPFLVDTCYIYLYGTGRKGFKENPADPNLLELSPEEKLSEDALSDKQISDDNNQYSLLQIQLKKKGRAVLFLSLIAVAAIVSALMLFYFYQNSRNELLSLKTDMNILPYQPTQMEIDSLEGVWLCYTGSPQARISYTERFHKVVYNLVDVKYKDGYFTYNRFGASFNHIGYMQFESPGIVSVYSRVNNNSNKTESPRHSLLNLNTNKKYLSAISASWNFDVGDKNRMIGIREIYVKLGKGGKIEEVMNNVENASCQCKVIRWRQANNQVQTFYLKNQLLDSLPLQEIKPLIDENSILLGIPQEGIIISKDSTVKQN